MNKLCKVLVASFVLASLSASPYAFARTKGVFENGNLPPEWLQQSGTGTETLVRRVLESPVFPVNAVPHSGLKTAEPLQLPAAATNGGNITAPAASPAKVLGDGTTILGSLLYSNTWQGTTGAYGIYSFPAYQYQLPELVYSQGSYEANGGGCGFGDKYYWNTYIYTEEMGYTFTTFSTYDFKTKEYTKNIQSFISDTFDLQQITNGLAMDPTTGRLYGLGNIKVVDAEGVIARYYPALSELDPAMGFATPIAQIPAMVAIAFSPAGELYTISRGTDAKLYRVNKETGDLKAIGSTGLSTDFAQSMAFDPISGKLYWAAVRANGATGLYEVDTATGTASLIFNFTNNEEYTGLFIPSPEAPEGAPSKVEGLVAAFSGGSLEGTLSLTAPSTTFSGSPLSGTLNLTVLLDNAPWSSLPVAPGESKTLPVGPLTEGIHTFTTFVSNASGEGPRTACAVYVGTDAPEAVGNPQLSDSGDGRALIQWAAPKAGRNGGWIDPSQLTYCVTRWPDGADIAQGISSTFCYDDLEVEADNYYYTITPWCGGREGIPASTQSMILGRGSDLPCRFTMDTKADFDLFTVIDANGDWDAEYKWGGWMYGPDFKYATEEDGKCAVYGYSPENAADDWLITPPVELQKSKKYLLSFTLWTRGDQEKIEVTAGPRNTVAAQKTIMPTATYTHKDHRQYTQEFTPADDGSCFIGFHITSDRKKYYAFIADVMVDEVPDSDAPSSVSNLTATPGAEGAEEVTLSFNAPAASMAGTPLASLDKIEIYHGNSQEVLKTFTAPAPSQALSWTEHNVSGMVEYRVVAFAAQKAGQKAEVSVYAGWDTPLAPTDAVVSDASGAPVVTWSAPATQGVHGGYVNPSQLKYQVYRYEDDLTLVGRDVTGTSFIDNSLDGSSLQHLVAYVVVASSPAGYSDPVATEHIVYGEPYDGIFLETFEDATVHSTPWVMYRLKGNYQNWGVTSYGSNPYCSPVGNDGGMAVYTTDGRVGDEGLLVSPKFDISQIPSPSLSFYLYHNYTDEHAAWDEAFQDRLIPEIIYSDGTREALCDPIYVDDLGTGWLKYSFPLDDFKQEPWIKVALHGITACEQDIYVDHLQISNTIYCDLQAYAFTGTGKVEAGKNASYKLTVFNRGLNPVRAGEYTVVLRDGDTKVAELPGPAIASREYETIVFSLPFPLESAGTIHVMTAAILWNDDEVQANNVSGYVQTRVTEPLLPEVHGLEAFQTDGSVTLSWGNPDAIHMDDSFEDYVPFEISDFGSYKTVDGDSNPTWGFSDIYFENTGEPQAFMVFNPVTLGVVFPATSLFPYDSFDPRTGSQVLACFQGLTVSGSSAVSATNDDWFISPEVFPGQTISFWAKSGDYMQGLDKYQVCYSTTDATPASFKPLSGVVTTDQNWTLCEQVLPGDAKYFAIHCVSEDGFVLFIDDLRFTAKAGAPPYAHIGYRLYRNGSAIGDFPTTTRQFMDNGLTDGEYSYEVSALYDGNRESKKSPALTIRIGESGMEMIQATGDNGPVYDLLGRRVDTSRPLDRGIYLMRGKLKIEN